MTQLLTYGHFGNELKHISAVKNGMACECYCPSCKGRLIAKNNPSNKKQSHFAHVNGTECPGALETALHILAKQILQKTKSLAIPDYHFDYAPGNPNSLFRKGKEVVFENVLIEYPIEQNDRRIVPDAIGEINNKRILVEFAKTHFVDERKKEKVIAMKIPCIEIDLCNAELSEESLQFLLNSQGAHKYWIANPRLDEEYRAFKLAQDQEQRKKTQEDREIKEKKKKEGEYKFQRYHNHKNYQLIRIEGGWLSHCPLEKQMLLELRNTKFY